LNLLSIKPLTDEYLESVGFIWHKDSDESAYIADEILEINEAEAEAFYEAGNELYEMFIKGAEYVIENNLFSELNIPDSLVGMVKKSWENDVHWHLYGRFDFAGGIDGKPIKLLEFNADTPTSVFESAIIQWAILKYNGFDAHRQFNSLYESLGENFKRLMTLEESTQNFASYNAEASFKILFSCMNGSIEDENTTRLLEYIATEAGYDCDFEFVENVAFSADGIFKDDEYFEFWFKLIPWEYIAKDEPELAKILNTIMQNEKAIILNPAYCLLFQSKAMLKILWDLYPNHPLLLESSFEPLQNKKQIQKVTLGREGANSAILDAKGNVEFEKSGGYGEYKSIYQEFVELPKDTEGRYYQAGVFYAYESCALGFRRGGLILDNGAKFVGHIIKN